MKTLFSTLLGFSEIFKEKRLIYDGLEAKQSAEIRVKTELVKEAPKDSDVAVQEEEKAGDSLYRTAEKMLIKMSSAMREALDKQDKKITSVYQSALLQLTQKTFIKEVSELGQIINQHPVLRNGAPKFDSISGNRDEAQLKLEQARIVYILENLYAYKSVIDKTSKDNPVLDIVLGNSKELKLSDFAKRKAEQNIVKQRKLQQRRMIAEKKAVKVTEPKEQHAKKQTPENINPKDVYIPEAPRMSMAPKIPAKTVAKALNPPASQEKPAETVVAISEAEANRLYESGTSLLKDAHSNSGRIFQIYTRLKNIPQDSIRKKGAELLYRLATSEEKGAYYTKAENYYGHLIIDFRGKDKSSESFISAFASLDDLQIKRSQCGFLSTMQTMLKKTPGTTVDAHDPDQVKEFFEKNKKYGLSYQVNTTQQYFNAFYTPTPPGIKISDGIDVNKKRDMDTLHKDYLGRREVDCEVSIDVVTKLALKGSISAIHYIPGGLTLDDKSTHVMAYLKLNNGEQIGIHNNDFIRLRWKKYAVEEKNKFAIRTADKILLVDGKEQHEEQYIDSNAIIKDMEKVVKRRGKQKFPIYSEMLANGRNPYTHDHFDSGIVYHADAGIVKVAQK